MMQCQDIDELMVEFLYQELDATQQQAFQAHMDSCARCGAEMKSLVRTRQALRELPDAEPSPSISARLLHEAGKRAAKADERGGALAWLSRFFGPLVTHPAWAAAASLVLVAGVAGLLALTGRVSERAQPAPVSVTTTHAPASEPAAAAPEPPRDVVARHLSADEGKALDSVAQDSLAKNEVANGELGRAKEKIAADKDVRAYGQEAPKEYTPKVTSPAVVSVPSVTKKSNAGDDSTIANNRDSFDARGNKQREGRTASAEEDQKLAKPSKPESKRMEGGLYKADGDDVGGVAAAPPPPAADPSTRQAEPADRPAQLADKPADKEEEKPQQPQRELAGTRRGDGSGAAGKAGGLVGAKQPPAKSAVSGQVASGPPAEPPPGGAPATTTAAPQPASPPPPPAASPAPQNEQVVTESKQKAAPKQPPEQELFQQAQKQASTGQCAQALGTRDRIARMNPEFYRKRVAGDATLKACDALSRKRAPAPREVKGLQEDNASEKSTK
jgi:anti-sigma factor RsiW